MRVLLLQLDGHSNYDDPERPGLVDGEVGQGSLLEPPKTYDRVYASLIFERTQLLASRVSETYPGAILGGTGWNLAQTLRSVDIDERAPLDWTIYPHERRSVGFSQRGCRLRCGFCVVPRKEGAVREEATIAELWRGGGLPRDLVLLDNDFFGQPRWRDRVRELREGNFRVSLTQGINARLVGDEEAEALASLKYYDDSFEKRRLYCAWDNKKDKTRLFAGLERLQRAGIEPSHLMVYVLVGYDHATNAPRALHDEDFYRVRELRALGADPYPMPFVRTTELQGFARWVCKGHDKRGVSWAEWVAAKYQPRNLGLENESQGRLFA